MKRSLFVLVISLLILLSACEVDQAVTGVRLQNQSGYELTEVLIVPSGAGFGSALDLLGSNVPPDDFREFETGVGTFDIRVEIAYEGYQPYPGIEVTENEVIVINVTDPFAES